MADAVWTLIETEAKYVTYRAASKDAEQVLDRKLENQYARIGYATLLFIAVALAVGVLIALTEHGQLIGFVFLPLPWIFVELVRGEALLVKRRRSGFGRINRGKWTRISD